jgi:transporter family-2 protein
MIGALAFDHFGLLGIPIHAVTPPRLVGAALLVAGAALIRL